MAGTTGLEPATSAVTGQRSNQLSYVPTSLFRHLDICHIESSVSQLSLFSLVSTISLLWTQFWASIDTKQTPKWTPNQVNATTQSSLSDTFYFGCPLNIAFVNLCNECRRRRDIIGVTFL